MAIQNGHTLGRQLCEVFGLDPMKVSGMTLNVDVCDIVTLDVRMVDVDGEGLTRTLESYTLTAREVEG